MIKKISKSSNDTFPTAMHISCAIQLNSHLLPTLNNLRNSLEEKVVEFDSLIKIGSNESNYFRFKSFLNRLIKFIFISL